MEIAGLRGERVRLVPSEAAQHLENALRWFNDPEITNLLDVFWGVTRGEEVAFFERLATQRDTDLHWALLNENDRHIGFIALHQIDWRIALRRGGADDRRAERLGSGLRQRRGPHSDPIRLRAARPASDRGAHP